MNAIDRILQADRKLAGRPKTRFKAPVWQIDREDPENNITIAVISMCIKDYLNQTMRELAIRVAEVKCRPVGECQAVLTELLNKGELGYYSPTITRDWTMWSPR